MPPDDLSALSAKNLGGGRAAKRASMLLFVIESHTAHLVIESQQAVARFISDKQAQSREQAFLEAMAQGRNLPLRPTIQDLERYAPQWAHLVPPDPVVRATVAHLLSEKYIFALNSVPLIRKALGLDDKTIKQAYQLRYDQPLSEAFAPDVSKLERMRWVWTRIAYRIDNLPPFWIVFFLTLTEAVGVCILAVPIALAGMGAIPGIIQVVALGLVNIMTIAALSESVVRDGNVRYGSTYFGRLISDYLGSVGNVVLLLAFLVLNITVFIAYGIGLAVTLADVTGIPSWVWPLAVDVVVLYFLIRQSFSATIASNLVLGLFSIGLIVIMALLAFPHIRTDYLLYMNVPFIDGRPFDPSSMSLIFGVILWAYFGYTSPVGAARLVLHRDPSGRSLIWGSIAAMVVAIVFNCVWVIAVNGTVAPEVLAAQTGTGLAPLAAQVGPLIGVVGLVFVVLTMGMSMIAYASAVYTQVNEWLTDWQGGSAEQPGTGIKAWLKKITTSRVGQFATGIMPVLVIFGITQWLLMTSQESFAGPLSFLGTLAVPLLGGIFPVLMLAASRRKGDHVPALKFRWLGHPFVIYGIYLLFIVSILLHGIIIWQSLFERLSALAASVIMIAMTIVVVRRGAFSSRLIVEMRVVRNPDEQINFFVTANGEPMVVAAHLNYADDTRRVQAATGEFPFEKLRSAMFELPRVTASEIKVWVHRTREGESSPLPARAVLTCGDSTQEYGLASQQVVIPSPNSPFQLSIQFKEEE